MWLLLLLFFYACVPRVGFPEGAKVRCVDAVDCGAGYSCAMLTGLCIAGVDEEAPELLAAEPLNATTVRIFFNEPVLIDAISTTPELAVEQVTLIDALTFDVHLAPMRPGEEYVISADGTRDWSGNALKNAATFTGFGSAPNREPPEALAPALDEVRYGLAPITLLWSPRPGLRTYTVTVGGKTETTTQTSLTFLPEAPGEYAWRVRADTSHADTVSRFHVVAGTIHVACDADPCEGGAGHASSPLRSLRTAMVRAVENDIAVVSVAARPSGLAYDGPIALVAGMSLIGASVERTLLHGGVIARSLTAAATLQHFAVRADAGSSALTIVENAAPLSITDNELMTSDGPAQQVVVQIESCATAPVLAGNVIHGGATTSDLVLVPGVGVSVRDGAVVLEDNTITGGDVRRHYAYGVWLQAVDAAVLTRNTIEAGSSTSSPVGGVLYQSTALVVESNANGTIVLDGNDITAGTLAASGISVGVHVRDHDVTLINNIVRGSYGLVVQGASRPLLAVNNVFASTSNREAIVDQKMGSTYANNVLFSPALCMMVQYSSARRFSLHNNAFVGCPTVLRQFDRPGGPSQVDISVVSELNLAATYNDGRAATSVGGNDGFASLTAAGLDLAFFPQESAPPFVLGGGLDAAHDHCGLTGAAPCGAVDHDRRNEKRTCDSTCFSVGAYERD